MEPFLCRRLTLRGRQQQRQRPRQSSQVLSAGGGCSSSPPQTNNRGEPPRRRCATIMTIATMSTMSPAAAPFSHDRHVVRAAGSRSSEPALTVATMRLTSTKTSTPSMPRPEGRGERGKGVCGGMMYWVVPLPDCWQLPSIFPLKHGHQPARHQFPRSGCSPLSACLAASSSNGSHLFLILLPTEGYVAVSPASQLTGCLKSDLAALLPAFSHPATDSTGKPKKEWNGNFGAKNAWPPCIGG